MRKFFGVLIIVITFFACLLAAIYMAEYVAPATITNSQNANFESVNQVNLLVIVVDQLQNPNPTFLSAWSVIIYHGSENGLIIIPLSLRYSENFDELSQKFHLTKQHTLTANSLNNFQKSLETQWDGQIVLDTEGLTALLKITTNQQIVLTEEEWVTTNANSDSLGSLLDAICTSIRSNPISNSEMFTAEIDNTNHLASPYSNETLAELWAKFSEEIYPHCEWHFVN